MTAATTNSSLQRGLLVVFSGPSGVGKDTILDLFLLKSSESPNPAVRCVTATTRKPRPGEVDGVAYHFLTEDQFQETIQADGFLEYADVFGKWYGTPKAWVEGQRTAGKDIVLKIDVQGAVSVKEKLNDAILIFLSPPSLDELERRLRDRATETVEQIDRRLNDARKEMAQLPHYDYCVVNNDIDEAVADLAAILRAEHCRIAK